MSKRRVVVTGLGLVTPVGNTVDTTWKALLSGKSGIAPITKFDASEFTTRFSGSVKDFDVEQYVTKKTPVRWTSLFNTVWRLASKLSKTQVWT